MCIEYNECQYGGMYNINVKKKEFLLLHKLCICHVLSLSSAFVPTRIKNPC